MDCHGYYGRVGRQIGFEYHWDSLAAGEAVFAGDLLGMAERANNVNSKNTDAFEDAEWCTRN